MEYKVSKKWRSVEFCITDDYGGEHFHNMKFLEALEFALDLITDITNVIRSEKL